MAGETLVTNSAFGKTSRSDFGHGTYSRVDRYGMGHSGAMWGNGYNNWFADDQFNMYIYYRTSDTAGWVQSAYYHFPDNSEYTAWLHCNSAHRHYCRWLFRWDAIYGDGKAGFQGGAQVYTSYYNSVAYNRKIYIASNFGIGTSARNPSVSTGIKITTAHNLIAQ